MQFTVGQHCEHAFQKVYETVYHCSTEEWKYLRKVIKY